MKEKSKNSGFVISLANPEFIKFIQLDLNLNNEYIKHEYSQHLMCNRFADGLMV